MVKNLPANAGDECTISGLERSPGGRHGNTLQYSCLENPMDRGAWWATVHRVTKSWTQVKQLSIHAVALKKEIEERRREEGRERESVILFSRYTRKSAFWTIFQNTKNEIVS